MRQTTQGVSDGTGQHLTEDLIARILRQLASEEGPGATLAGVWNYPTFAVARFNLPTEPGTKTRRSLRPVHSGRLGYPDGPRPLFNLDLIASADSVAVGEGEGVPP